MKLHESVTNSNPQIDSLVSLNEVVKFIVTAFNEALVASSMLITASAHIYLTPLLDIITAITKKKYFHKLWQLTKDQEIKKQMNSQIKLVREKLQKL